MSIYDCIVVGAGIEGSATAYQLAKIGVKTLLLEQFSLLHSDGSSHGLSRLTRRAYAEECLAALMEDAHKEWRELERLSGQSIYIKHGCVTVAKHDMKYFNSAIEFLKKYNAPFTILSNKALEKEFPHLSFSDDYKAVLDIDGGIILANNGLAAFQEQYRKFGGQVIDNCKVHGIIPGDHITVKTTYGNYLGKAVIICVGSWAGEFAKSLGLSLPIQPQRPYFMYWREKEIGSHTIPKGMPTFIDLDTDFYGFPSLEYPGLVKVCFDGGNNFDVSLLGDDDKPPAKLDELKQYVKDHLQGLVPTPEIMGKCKYAVTPDRVFILDKHPKYPNIVFGAGFSGKGFKFAPVVGNILKDLALNRKSKYDLSGFRMDRFKSPSINSSL